MFDNNNNNNDNAVLIDTDSRSSRNRKQKINCVICFPKVELTCINLEEKRFKCMRCKNTYQLGYEIIPQENILESSHEEDYEDSDADNKGLLVADNDLEFDNNNDYETKSDIPIPKYMKNSDTTEVIEYREE